MSSNNDQQPSSSPHNYSRPKPSDDEEEDPFETMLKRTGCAEQHYSVQVIHLISYWKLNY